MNTSRIIFISLLFLIVLSLPPHLYAICVIEKPSIQTRIGRFLERFIIMTQFDPKTRINSYIKKTQVPPHSYEELIQQTHALTLTVAELHRLRTIDSSMYETITLLFPTFIQTLEHVKSQQDTCTNELDSLIHITQKNQQVAQELLLNRLPEFRGKPIDK